MASSSKNPGNRLRRAIQDGNLPLVRRLLNPPVSSSAYTIDARNPDALMLTSLAWAAICGYEELFEYLVFDVGHDDDELSRDGDNNTILHLLAGLPTLGLTPPHRVSAFAGGDLATRLASIYFDRFSFVLDWSNTEDKTALHIAAQEGKEGFVNLLIDLGADVDLPDMYGNTPLHYASAWNHLPVCQTLIERGCRFRERNNDGFTASDFAYSVSLQAALTNLARAQFDSKRLNKRTHTGLTSSTAYSSHSVPTDEYRSVFHGDSVDDGRHEGGPESEGDGGSGMSLRHPGYGSPDRSAFAIAGGGGYASDLSSSAYLSPPRQVPVKPLLNTNVSSYSNATSDSNHPTTPILQTVSAMTSPALGGPPSPAPSSPSRFHFHRSRHRDANAPPTPPPPISVTPVSPFRLRSTSNSTQTTGPSSTTTSSRSRTSSGEPRRPPTMILSGAPSLSADSSASGSKKKRDKEGKEPKEKWGLGRHKPSKLVPPLNMKKSMWGSKSGG